MSTIPLKPAATAALTIACCSGCHLLPDMPDPLEFPEANARNLEELHGPGGEYRYKATLVGDFGYLIESITGRDRATFLKQTGVANPGLETQDNLIDLLEISKGEDSALNLQVEWCARLVSSDPSDLVRERAALGLGELGHWVGLRTLDPPSNAADSASPDKVGAAIEAILKSLRLVRDEGADLQEIAAACVTARALNLDLDGAWRMLSVASQFMGLATSPEAEGHIANLIQHLRADLIQGGVYRALNDPSDLVRVAGIRAMVKIMGPRALAGPLSKPLPEWSDTVILGLVDIVADHGLPSEGLSESFTAACLDSLTRWAVDHPSPRVRARSMLALQRVAPSGPRSLREEDWHQWAERREAQFGPSP